MANLTPKQEAWFAAVKASLERDTGRTLDQWAEIVRRDCTETKHRARQVWLKDRHGLGSNRASVVLDAAFPSGLMGWEESTALRKALWKDEAILLAVEALIAQIPEVIPTQRKGYSAWSRNYQFAALKPVRDGALLGLAVPPASDSRLMASKTEGWSERLKSTLRLTTLDSVSQDLLSLLQAAWQSS